MEPIFLILSGVLLLRFNKCHQLKRRVLISTGVFLSRVHLEFQMPPVRNNSGTRRRPHCVPWFGTKSKERSDSPFVTTNSRDSPLSRIIFEITQANGTFKCDTCSKSFKESVALKVHLRFHTDQRPFSCEVCSKSFKDSAALKVHLRVHTGRQKCDILLKSVSLSPAI